LKELKQFIVTAGKELNGIKSKMKYLVYISLLLSVASCSLSKFSKGKMEKATSDVHSFPIESIDGIIVLNVKVNGVEGRFILDNGFSICALDQNFAKKASVTFQKIGSVNDANNNTVELLETRIESIAVGTFNLKNSIVNQLETALFLPCDSIDGVLGATFINKVNWKIDFEQKTASISKEEFESVGQVLEFSTGRNNISTTQVEINGKSLKTMIDFGYQGYIQLNKKNFFTNDIRQQAEVRVGIQSLSVSGLGNIDTTYLLTKIPVSQSGKSFLETSELVLKSNLCEEAIIGINYFENYEVIINNSSHQYILTPRNNYIAPSKNNFNVGLYSIGDGIKIVQLNVNDPIAQNLELLENVVSIDGKPAANFIDICDLKAYMKKKRIDNESVLIQVEGNTTPIEIHARTPIKQSITFP